MTDTNIIEAYKSIENVLSKSSRPLVAFSGGKDGFVTAYLCNKVWPGIEMVCEASFYFDIQKEDINLSAERHSFNLTCKESLTDQWLLKHPQVIFSPESKVRAWSFHARQQKTVKAFARQIKADVSIYGRRTEENSVPKELYTTKEGLQFHPLRSWSTNQIWSFFDGIREPKPRIYSYRFGALEGNAPFYSLNSKGKNMDECWDIVNEIDEKRLFEFKFRESCIN